MAKVGSKLEIEIPRAVAEELGLEPGDDVDVAVVGRELRVVPVERKRATPEERLALFDATTKWLEEYWAKRPFPPGTPMERDWTREQIWEEELAKRGSSR